MDNDKYLESLRQTLEMCDLVMYHIPQADLVVKAHQCREQTLK